jgi:hypothetical protein
MVGQDGDMRARHELYVTRGLYFLGHRGQAWPSPAREPGTAGRLLYRDANGGGGVALSCGTFDGPVDLTVETFDDRPAELPDGDWEYVEELESVSTGRDIIVGALEEVEHTFPVLPVGPDDRYGVRVVARGVMAAADEGELDLDAEPIEHHSIQLWHVTRENAAV